MGLTHRFCAALLFVLAIFVPPPAGSVRFSEMFAAAVIGAATGWLLRRGRDDAD